MNPVMEATQSVNEMLKLVGEEPIPLPTDGTTKQRLESLFDIYTDRLVTKNPKYKIFKDKKEIPDLIVMYLNKMIAKQK